MARNPDDASFPQVDARSLDGRHLFEVEYRGVEEEEGSEIDRPDDKYEDDGDRLDTDSTRSTHISHHTAASMKRDRRNSLLHLYVLVEVEYRGVEEEEGRKVDGPDDKYEDDGGAQTTNHL